MSAPTPPLEDLVEFPSVFVFRAVGDAQDDLAGRCATALAQSLGRPAERVETHPSSAGRFLSVRLAATVLAPADILAVYAALRAVQGVRLVL